MVSGYQIIEILYESSRSLICRGRRDRDSAAVVLKQLKPDYATPETVTRFKREYDLTRCCHLDGVIQLYGLEAAEHSWVMIEEDGGQSLDRYCADRTLSLEDFLQLAIQLT
jgi:serine/threonine protein kinase